MELPVAFLSKKRKSRNVQVKAQYKLHSLSHPNHTNVIKWLILNYFAESNVIRSVSGVQAFCIVPEHH